MEPVFLIGAERSGTTLLRLMLDGHESISMMSEFEYSVDQLSNYRIWPNTKNYVNWLTTNRIFQDSNFSIDISLTYQELIKSFLKQHSPDERKIVGATCHRYYNRLLWLFPKCRFIYIYRDPRDVAKSNIKMGWAGNVWFGVNRWIEAETLWNSVKQTLTRDSYIEICYESLISSTIIELTRICEFLNIEYSSNMMKYPKFTTYTEPDPTISKRWKRVSTTREIKLIELKARDLMKARGYSLAFNQIAPLSFAESFYLKANDKFNRIRFRINRYGFTHVFCSFIARRFTGKLNKYWAMKENAINRKHLK